MNTKKYSVFIQTDKAVYKPSDKVQFRILILNADTKPFMPSHVEVFISDSASNRIKQYEKVFFRRGVFKQELQLSDEPELGLWAINVRVNDGEVESVKNFEVDEYVLPKFEVNVKTKTKVAMDQDIVVSYSAKYTYGKEVDGTAVVTAELSDYWWGQPPTKVVKFLDSSTKTTSISIRKDLNLNSIDWTRTVLITISFTEALTGKQRNATEIVQIINNPYTIEMKGSDYIIKPSIPFTAKAFVTDLDNTPVTDNKVPIIFNVSYTYDTYESSDSSSTTPFIFWWRPFITKVVSFNRFLSNGMAEIPLSITSNVTSLNIQSYYKDAVGYLWAGTNPTESNQYIEINIPETISVTKTIPVEIISNCDTNSISYVVVARNKIVRLGRIKSSDNKSFKLFLQPTPEMVPTAKFVAFYIASNGEIISDNQILEFGTELRNFVSFIKLFLK